MSCREDDGGTITAIDNRSGEAWTENFGVLGAALLAGLRQVEGRRRPQSMGKNHESELTHKRKVM